MASSKTIGYNFKGEFDANTGLITETLKEEIRVYNLYDKLKNEFDGKVIQLTVKETSELESLTNEDFED